MGPGGVGDTVQADVAGPVTAEDTPEDLINDKSDGEADDV